MGKMKTRLASRKQAKRWPKGQSSSSNPETLKHRQQAAWSLITDTSGTPGITKEDLKKHDAIQGIGPELEKLDIDDHEESTVEGTVDTTDTFASSYSNCSNISFNRFLNHFQSNSLLHKEMLAVLSAVAEVIKQNGGTETSTEYFAALMSTLEAVEEETSVAATLSLLGMGLKTVPVAVLNTQFGAASQCFLHILTKYTATENFHVLRHCIRCICLLLRAQEAAAWTNSSTMQVLDVILSFSVHSKPKVRKAAQHGICAILKGSDIMRGENPPAYHPAAPQVAKHCIEQLNSASKPGGITSVLHILTLLKDIMHQLPKSNVKTICEGLLTIMGLKNVLVTSCCLQTLHSLFVSRPTETTLPSQRNAQIIAALYDYQPAATDTQPTLAWLAVMQEAHCNLAHSSLNLCAAIINRMFEKCTELWLSDKSEVTSGVSNTMKTLLQDCIGPLCEVEENVKRYKSTIDQTIVMLQKALSYQYLGAWNHILHLIALLFQITGKTKNPKLLETLKTLTELRESYNFTYTNDAEYAIGAAVKYMGPQPVLDTIPLKTSDNAINLTRGWLLPLLKDCICQGSISFFTNTLLPLINICENKSKEPTGGKTYEFLISQLWAILPNICSAADDVKQNFKSIAKMLGVCITDKKDLRLSAMAALRKLITRATEIDAKEDISELAQFAKNYLPILFNVYTTKPNGTDGEGQRLAAFDTIKVYLTIANKQLVDELFDRALGRLKEPNTDDFFKDSVYDLVRILTPYTDGERLKTFYDMCVLYLKETSKPKEQKKAYRFLEEVCGSEIEVCKEFVLKHRREMQKLLTSSATTVVKTSRGARLRCLCHLVKSHPQLEKTKFLEAIVPEAILCVKDINGRCRASAYRLLNMIAEKFLANPNHLKDYSNMLIVGLGGQQKYCSATLLALASITYHYNGSLGIETVNEILHCVCGLLASSTREIVESSLSYIKVYITVMPSPIVAVSMPKIVNALSHMEDDCKRHFRLKVRDIFTKFIRKYGYSTVTGLVPSSDAILLKRLKNIHKVEEMKKKTRELKKLKQMENAEDEEFSVKRRPKSMEEILADSDDEIEGSDNDEPRKNKKRTSRKEAWIQETGEDIVDLIDPAATRNITTTLPGMRHPNVPAKKPKEHGFKTAPDGRLIITEDNGRDSDTEGGKRKRKAPFLNSDSEDDYDANDDAKSVATAMSGGRKRKHSDSSDGVSTRSYSTSKYQAGGSGIHRPLKGQQKNRTPGNEYRAHKAGGDIKKKGKPDPYAYVPLTRSSLNKRKKKKNAGKFENLIAGAKKGARAGMKSRRKNHD